MIDVEVAFITSNAVIMRQKQQNIILRLFSCPEQQHLGFKSPVANQSRYARAQDPVSRSKETPCQFSSQQHAKQRVFEVCVRSSKTPLGSLRLLCTIDMGLGIGEVCSRSWLGTQCLPLTNKEHQPPRSLSSGNRGTSLKTTKRQAITDLMPNF